MLKGVSRRLLSAPPQARERGFHHRRHPTDSQAEASGDARHATAAGDDQVPAGARASHQGQHLMHRQGEMHAHAQDLPQHAPPGGLHLHWPLRQPRPFWQPRPLRRILLLRRRSTLWRPRLLRWPRPMWRHVRLWRFCCTLLPPRLLLCAGVLNGITLGKS